MQVVSADFEVERFNWRKRRCKDTITIKERLDLDRDMREIIEKYNAE